MTVSLILPILIPLTAAVLMLFAGQRPRWQQALGFVAAGGLLAAAVFLFLRVRRDGILVAQLGNWPAPYGIVLVADLFAAAMVVLTGIIGFAAVLYTGGSVDDRRLIFGHHFLVAVILAGCCGVFLTGDLFNLYVWFEVVLMGSFVLLLLGSGRPQMAGGVKYVTINLVASALFLVGVALIYGQAGTLNMAHLARKLHLHPSPQLFNGGGLLLLTAFGIKAALFPLYFWLPAAYPTPPPAVSALFAGLLTKLGAYAMLRVFTLIFPGGAAFLQTLLLTAALLTMVSGALGAVAQTGLGRLLSFSIVSQMGYILLGLGFFDMLALAAAIFFIFHESLVKSALFMAGGMVVRLRRTDQFASLGGFGRSHPWLAGCFLTCSLSLAGIPPFSGFFAKFGLVKAAFRGGYYPAAAVALAVSVITLSYMGRAWMEVFWKAAPEPAEGVAMPVFLKRQYGQLLLAVMLLTAGTLLLGVWGEPFWEVARQAAADLHDPSRYIAAVLGG